MLAVDDSRPALAALCALLSASPHVAEVVAATDGVTALRRLRTGGIDAVFLDVAMPGLDGLEIGELLDRMADAPPLVFVTGSADHAVRAFGLGAVDYVLKPVAADRVEAAVRRIRRVARPDPAPAADAAVEEFAALPVGGGGRTRYVRRAEVRFVEASGDAVRLHTAAGAHPARVSISRLEGPWGRHGFVRVHRSFLVCLSAVLELCTDVGGGLVAHTDAGDVPVSRRHARTLRDTLLRAASRGDLERWRREG